MMAVEETGGGTGGGTAKVVAALHGEVSQPRQDGEAAASDAALSGGGAELDTPAQQPLEPVAASVAEMEAVAGEPAATPVPSVAADRFETAAVSDGASATTNAAASLSGEDVVPESRDSAPRPEVGERSITLTGASGTAVATHSPGSTAPAPEAAEAALSARKPAPGTGDRHAASSPITDDAAAGPPSHEPRTAEEAQTADAAEAPLAEVVENGPEQGAEPVAAAARAQPVAEPAAPESAPPAPAEAAAGELEELVLTPTVVAPEPRAAGAAADAEGTVRIERLLGQRGRVNHYLATRAGAETLHLREAAADHAELAREAEVLAAVRYPMLPSLAATWQWQGRRYLATSAAESEEDAPVLREAIAGIAPAEAASVAVQLAQALRRLHAAGWALPGLRPDGVLLTQPVRITRLSGAQRLGERPSGAVEAGGYTAPELALGGPLTGKEDVYALAALLFHMLSGTPPPEQGLDSAALAALHVGGAPQLLAPALADPAGRPDLETFYAQLLAFKRRLTAAPLALRVASGSNIGLNLTRTANEDACGYLTWSTAAEGRTAYHAVLCAIDGMGGMEAGEVAATAALRAVLSRAAGQAAERIAGAPGADREADAPAVQPLPLDPRALVHSAAEAAYVAARGRQVGATVTCAAIDDGVLRLAHVGDTRAYLLRDGGIEQLTRDHSLAAAMVASGLLTPEEARGHPASSKVLRSLGGLRRLPDDHIDSLASAHGTETLALRPGDHLLLCSDGVWGVLRDAELAALVAGAADLDAAVAEVLRRVLAGGAPDNACIVLARVVTMPFA